MAICYRSYNVGCIITPGTHIAGKEAQLINVPRFICVQVGRWIEYPDSSLHLSVGAHFLFLLFIKEKRTLNLNRARSSYWSSSSKSNHVTQAGIQDVVGLLMYMYVMISSSTG